MLSIGIVGLPNVGKSTLFNALVESAKAESSNYPFTTIEPNVGIVAVPDERLTRLAEIERSAKITPAAIKFVDIAGLVEGASKGEGLGNKFLSHIKEVDAIMMVVRCFEDPNIIHIAGKVSPTDDMRVIMLELILADLEQVTKALERAEKDAKSGSKESLTRGEVLRRMKIWLESEKPLQEHTDINENDYRLVKDIQLITNKPLFFVANVAEDQLDKTPAELDMPDNTIVVSARLETELKELNEQDRVSFVGAGHIAPLVKIIQTSYSVLCLISFLTAGEMEARAWPILAGMKAPQAAGTIHGDFEKKFIAADVVSYENFVSAGGWVKARENGLVRTEGKEYAMRDGDVVVFKHGN